MTKLEMLKEGTSLVLSIGCGVIVGNVVKTTSPANMGKLKDLCVGVSSLVLGSMLGDQASEYADKKIDEVAERVKIEVIPMKKEDVIVEEMEA